MKLKFTVTILVVALAAAIVVSQSGRAAFKPAEDFPRRALVYAQVKDLPAFIKFWSESKLKEKYLESENFQDLKNRHLGLKLASRWEEFSSAAGFPIELETLGGLASNQAAVALYDVGKLEFVFIAPVSDEIFAATKFVQNQDKFAEETFPDGTIIRRVGVEADRGRQRQQLIFTHVKNRFILATSEKLLAETLDNINGKSAKNRLIDEPAFADLSNKIEPHLATVWVNQAALNDDYYFKRYWLMSDTADLKNIRAGIFDFEMQEEKFVERRKFLVNRAAITPPINPVQVERLVSRLPENIPFYRLRSANNRAVNGAIRDAIFDRRKNTSENKTRRRRHYPADDYSDYESPDYYYLGEKFDETIDETDQDETIGAQRETSRDFSKILQPANPQIVLTYTRPQILPAPLFVEFRRAAIFALGSPANFSRDSFEAEIEKSIAAQVLISAPNVKLKWETKGENDAAWRELNLPMLGWSVSYAQRGGELILTNNADFLREIMAAGNSPGNFEKPNASLTELTVLNLNQRESAYDRIFAELAGKNAADDFFTGSVASLLDSVSNVERIETRKFYSNNLAEEELLVYFH